MSLPDGVEHRDIAGETSIATRGEPVYGEPASDGWRRWNPNRSKLGAMLELGMETGLQAGDGVLYLGAANGTTVSHVADFAGPTYAIEFAPRSARDLVDVAESRRNLFPLLKDARNPDSYSHVVEAGLDAIVQDVATRGQARVAVENARFLSGDGRLLMAVKARSEDVTSSPDEVFGRVRADLESTYEVLESRRLDEYHLDHLGIVARPL